MTYTKLPIIQVIQKSISFAWFSKGLDFLWASKCDYVKPGFISKSDYLKYQCFGSTGSEGGKVFIQTDLFLTVITNFQVLDNWKAFVHFMFQRFSKYNAQMFETQVYLFHVLIHIKTKFRLWSMQIQLSSKNSSEVFRGDRIN